MAGLFFLSAATIDAFLLAAYAVAYTLVAAAYAWTTFFNRNHFYLQARLPRFLLIDLVLITFIVTSYAFVQVLVELGIHVSKAYADFATFVAVCTFVPLHLLKGARLVIIFSPGLRGRYGRYWTKTRMLCMLLGCFCLTLLVLGVSLLFGKLMTMLAVMSVNTLLLITLVVLAKRFQVLDRIGIVQEFRRMLAMLGLWFAFVFPVRLWGDTFMSATMALRLVTWLVIALFTGEIAIVHILPSLAYKYDPYRSLQHWRAAYQRKSLSLHSSDSVRSIPAFSAAATLKRMVSYGVAVSPTLTTGITVNVSPKASAATGALTVQFRRLPAHDDTLVAILQAACRKFLCEESLLFLLAVRDLQRHEDAGVDDDATLRLEAERIVKTYVKPGSKYEINISSSQMHRCLKAFAKTSQAVMANAAGVNAVTVGGVGGNGDAPPATASAVRPFTSNIFREAFDEIEVMLAQNIMASVEELEEYQVAVAANFITTNQLA